MMMMIATNDDAGSLEKCIFKSIVTGYSQIYSQIDLIAPPSSVQNKIDLFSLEIYKYSLLFSCKHL